MIFKHSTVVLQPNHIVKSFKYGIPDRNQLQGRTDDTPQKRMLKQLYLSMVVMGLLITLQTILRGKGNYSLQPPQLQSIVNRVNDSHTSLQYVLQKY